MAKRASQFGSTRRVLWLAAFFSAAIVQPCKSGAVDASGPAASGDGFKAFPTPLSSQLPYDVDTKGSGKSAGDPVLTVQRDFDIFSWQMFLALNWPVDPQGKPLPLAEYNENGKPRLWTSWRTADTIFLPNGAKPAPWEESPDLAAEQNLSHVKAAWRQGVTNADENFQAFSGPLVDQNGKWVRYEVLVNRTEFDYLFKNGLYSLEGQEVFSKREKDNVVDFPANEGERYGATEIKLSWKQLGPNDDASRFYTTKAKIRRSEPAGPGQPPPEEVIDVGLVGMHIAVRTKSAPEWVWATFEQVDNVAIDAHAVGKDGKPLKPNFNNPSAPCTQANVLPDKNAVINPATGQPVPETDLSKATTWIESLTTTPVQVTRVDVPTQGQLNPYDKAIAATTDALNEQVQEILRQQGSVFQYYKLIGTQWPLHPNAPAFAGGEGSAPESITHKTPGDMVPVFLVNTTMETYFQKGKQPAGPLEQDDRLAPTAPPIDSTVVIGTESCVGCHYSSGICIGFKKNSQGQDIVDPVTKLRTPIFGENSHFGATGNAHFSWLLQIEARSQPVAEAAVKAPVKQPAEMLDIKKYLKARMAPAAKALQ